MVATVNSTGTSTGVVITPDSSGVLALQTAGTTAITVDASQNVGIGTSSPAGKLEVNSSGTPKTITSYSTTNFNALGCGASGGSLAYGSGTFLTFCNQPFADRGTDNNLTERMRIDSSGNLLVGTTSTFSPGGVPTTNSVSNGTSVKWAQGIRNTASSTPYGLAIEYPNAAPNSTGSQFIYCPDNTGTKFEARSNGGIANYSANNVNLSDQREKKNIEFSSNYLNKICQIPVKTFLFNDQTDDELNLGAIAQEVQAVAPELVSESNWGTVDEPKMRLSIYQTDLQYALMKSIQELKAINDTQAETINALTARIVALEGQ